MRFLLLMMFMLMGQANAADIFHPVANDISIQLLNAIFPGLTGSGGADAVAGAMGIFNGAILIVGGILATYTLLAGTLGTAHDGEMLGKKFSSVWIPIRYSLGTALVLPVVGGGYSMMQQIVMWLVIQSVGMADNVWTKFVESQNLTNIAAVSIQSPDAKQLAYTTLNTEVCMAALAWAQAGNGDKIVRGNINSGITVDDGLISKTYMFGDKNETSGLKKDTCGTVTFTKFTMPVQTANGFTNFIAGFANAQKIINAQESQYAGLVASVTPIAAKIFKDKSVGDVGAMQVAINTYQSNVAKGAAAMITSSDAFSDLSKNASQDGWGAAGFWFVKLSNMMDLVQRSLAAVPTAIGPQTESASVLEYYADAVPAVVETINKGGANLAGMGMGNEDGGSNTSWWGTIKSAVKNLDPTVIVKKAFTSSTNFVIQDGEHPLIALKRIGNTTLAIAGAGFGGCMAALATVGNAPGVGMAIASAMFMAVIPLAIIGVTLSYVIPFMPALIWISILIGWFIQVIEAVIAASIWAVMHLHPSGDDLTGKGGNGYNLVLGIIFRPVLSVFGLMAALLTMQIFGQFINKIFADAFLVSQQDSGLFVWLVGLIAAPLIYCVAMFTIVKKLFEIVHIIPDQLMQWIGGGSHTLGEYAKSMGSGGDHSQMLAAGMNVVNQQGNNAMSAVPELKKNGSLGGKLTDKQMTQKGMSQGQKDIMSMVQGGMDGKKGMSQSAMAMQSKHEGIMKDLGSASPEMSKQYQENLTKMAENPNHADMSTDELMQGAMESTIRQNYGQGAVSALRNYAGGQSSGPEFQAALGAFETARQGAVADYGQTGYKKELMAASSAINSEFQANARNPAADQVAPSEIFSKHLGRFNDVDAVAQAPATPEPVAAPVESSAPVEAPIQATEPAVETPAVEPQTFHSPETPSHTFQAPDAGDGQFNE